MKAIMNHPHETATDELLLQPAVFAVLQFRGLKRGNSCRTARTANCKWWYSFAETHNRQHYERI